MELGCEWMRLSTGFDPASYNSSIRRLFNSTTLGRGDLSSGCGSHSILANILIWCILHQLEELRKEQLILKGFANHGNKEDAGYVFGTQALIGLLE